MAHGAEFPREVASRDSHGADHRGRDIPWPEVVRFHEEIVARAEEGFFSLALGDDQTERWTSLSDFQPTDLRGPWRIAKTDIRSRPFALALEQGEHETVFLGGPCYFHWTRLGNDQLSPQWRPLLYREVEVRATRDGWEIVPREGEWGLSPLVQGRLHRPGVRAGNDAADLVARVMENTATYHQSSGESLDRCVLRALLDVAPELESEIVGQLPGDLPVTPTSWVLFAPNAGFSATVAHLMADYERLEEVLAGNPADIGGLKVLEDRPFSGNVEDDVDVLPIVPLNDAQQDAVKAILSDRPLTVISGPPGTGKSQVVVSLLLNAWAKGKSVLFVSNNKKAVDDVRERLERFESEFPIAVRAGGWEHQNIQEVLRRTVNIASAAGRKKFSSGYESALIRRRRMLLEEKVALEDTISTNLPQRIDEARRAALRAYGNYRSMLTRAAEDERKLLEEKQRLGLGAASVAQVEQAVMDTSDWLERVVHYQQLIEQDRLRAAQLNEQRLMWEERRNRTLERIGLTPEEGGDWSWLQAAPGPSEVAQWERQIRELVAKPLEDILKQPTWDKRFDRWNSESHAAAWSKAARGLAKAAKELFAQIVPLLSQKQELEAELREERDKITYVDPSSAAAVPPEALQEWLAAYAEYATSPLSISQQMPWSPRARAERRLRAAEDVLRVSLPLELWVAIGTLNDGNRKRLAAVLLALQRWLAVKRKLDDVAEGIAAIEEQFVSIRQQLTGLEEEDFPAGTPPLRWPQLARECLELADLATDAAEGWRHREQREQLIREVRAMAAAWTQLGSGVPVWDAWCRGPGAVFDEAMKALAEQPDHETLQAARRALYSGSLTLLLDVWQESRDYDQRRLTVEKQINAMPTPREYLVRWWHERPESAFVMLEKPDRWPDPATARGEMDQVVEWMSRWRTFERETKPEMLRVADEELNWAVSQLEHVAELLPEGEQSDTAAKLIGVIVADPKAEWPVSQLNETLSGFGVDQLNARMARIEAQLEKLSFEYAQASWLQRLQGDDATLRAMDRLETAISSFQGKFDKTYTDDFRRALKAAPIWIAAARAPQAIPLEANLFDIVVIDEASQCTLTDILPVIYRGRTLAVIGDEYQLPAVPTIREAEEASLAEEYDVEDQLSLLGHVHNDVYKTAMQSLPRRRADVIQLADHFNSHPQIIGFANRYVYTGTLQLKKHPYGSNQLPIPAGVHMRHVPGDAARGPNGRSWVNIPEADAVLALIQELSDAGGPGLSVGVITPFSAQKQLLRERLHDVGLGSHVLVDTAYGFQGDSRDVIIFSPVVAKGITDSAARWLEAPLNLVNAATTRPRELLFVVADFDFCLAQQGILRQLAQYCKDIQQLRDTSAAELELFSWMVVQGWEPIVHPVIDGVEVDFELVTEKGVRLVVEVDGSPYALTRERDAAVDVHLQASGRKVLRVSAREVHETPLTVIHRIEQLLQSWEKWSTQERATVSRVPLDHGAADTIQVQPWERRT